MPTVQGVINGILQFDLATIPGYVVGKALSAVMRSEAAMRIRSQLGIPIQPQNFEEAYKAAIIDYGIEKPQPLLDLFRNQDMQQAFRTWFDESGEQSVISMLEAVIENSAVGAELTRLELTDQMKKELYIFGEVFEQQVNFMKDLPDQMQDRAIRRLNISVQNVVIMLNTKANTSDVNELSDHIKQQEKIVSSIESRLNDIREVPEPIMYYSTIFRDRRQSELAAFLDAYDVNWDYFLYSEQMEPTIVLPGPRFEIKNLLGFADKELLAVTIPMGVSESKFVWSERFREEINQLSNEQDVLVVLRVTAEKFISDESNLEPSIGVDEILPNRSQDHTGDDLWHVSHGSWNLYSWYICPVCDQLSAVYNVSVWEIQKGYEAPLETCPNCLEEYWSLCPRCEEYKYDIREASYCEYCQYQWDKLKDE